MEINYSMRKDLDSVVRTYYISSRDQKLVALEESTRSQNYTEGRYLDSKRILP